MTPMSATRPNFTRSLGADLECDRLERRVTRVTVAIAVLRERASEHRPELGARPRHLRHALADFEAQIESMNARLREFASGPGSTQVGIERSNENSR
jgi:hypothetical protein